MLEIDAAKLTAEVKFEAAAPVGEKETTNFVASDKKDEILFPHLYGTIDFQSVHQELSVERADDGTFLSISGL